MSKQAKHYRDMAERSRNLVKSAKEGMRAHLMNVAEQYEKLARRSEGTDEEE